MTDYEAVLAHMVITSGAILLTVAMLALAWKVFKWGFLP